jgi:hypothetical protein
MSVQPPAPATIPVETLQGNRRQGQVVDELVEADADGFDRVFRVDVDGVTMRVDEDDVPDR